MKEENKRIRKIENELKQIWADAGLSAADTWETAKKLIKNTDDAIAYEKKEGQLDKVWEDYVKESEVSCSHHHSRSRKSKKTRNTKSDPNQVQDR